MRKLNKAQLKNKIEELSNYRDELNTLNKRQKHIRNLFSLISTVGEGKEQDSIERIIKTTEQIPEKTQIPPIHRVMWKKKQSNITVDLLKSVEEEIDSAEKKYHKLSLTNKEKKEKRRSFIGFVAVISVILVGVFAFHGYNLKMEAFENSTEGKLKRISEYTVDVQEDKDNYVQLNKKNHIQWEDGENTVIEFFVDWLQGEKVSGKYGKADDRDSGWRDGGNGWLTLKYNDKCKFLGKTSDVMWDLGIIHYSQYYFNSYSWTTDASEFSDGVFECAVYAIGDLKGEEIKGYNIYMRNNSIKEYTATWKEFTLECDAYSTVVRWTIELTDE